MEVEEGGQVAAARGMVAVGRMIPAPLFGKEETEEEGGGGAKEPVVPAGMTQHRVGIIAILRPNRYFRGGTIISTKPRGVPCSEISMRACWCTTRRESLSGLPPVPPSLPSSSSSHSRRCRQT